MTHLVDAFLVTIVASYFMMVGLSTSSCIKIVLRLSIIYVQVVENLAVL